MKYKLTSVKETFAVEQEAIDNNISIKARSANGWFHTLKTVKSHDKMPHELIRKRDSFIARTLAQYLKNPTYRRYISLRIWSYDPKSP